MGMEVKLIINENEDGIAHINIYSQGKTALGKMLSNFYKFDINTKDGHFKSVEGYWYWLGLEDCEEKEILRSQSGFQAKKVGNELRKKYKAKVDVDFNDKIIRAIWYKVQRNMKLFDTEIAGLPFEHYYNFGGKIHDVKDKYPWMIEGISKMRDYILRENKKGVKYEIY